MRYHPSNGPQWSPPPQAEWCAEIEQRVSALETRLETMQTATLERSERQEWSAMWRGAIADILKRLPFEHIGYGLLVLLLLAAHQKPELRSLLLAVLGVKA